MFPNWWRFHYKPRSTRHFTSDSSSDSDCPENCGNSTELGNNDSSVILTACSSFSSNRESTYRDSPKATSIHRNTDVLFSPGIEVIFTPLNSYDNSAKEDLRSRPTSRRFLSSFSSSDSDGHNIWANTIDIRNNDSSVMLNGCTPIASNRESTCKGSPKLIRRNTVELSKSGIADGIMFTHLKDADYLTKNDLGSLTRSKRLGSVLLSSPLQRIQESNKTKFLKKSTSDESKSVEHRSSSYGSFNKPTSTRGTPKTQNACDSTCTPTRITRHQQDQGRFATVHKKQIVQARSNLKRIKIPFEI